MKVKRYTRLFRQEYVLSRVKCIPTSLQGMIVVRERGPFSADIRSVYDHAISGPLPNLILSGSA